MLKPRDPTPAESVLSSALAITGAEPWVGGAALRAATEAYWALVVAGLVDRAAASEGPTINLIAAQLEEIQKLNDAHYCGPSPEQHLALFLQSENILK